MENSIEKQTHSALKQQGKNLLLSMGYSASEISEEYRLKVNGDKGFIIDVVGISEIGKTAIECGHTDAIKAASLSLFFDKVILLPFNVEVMSSELQKELFKDATVIESLNKKIVDLEDEVKTLKEKISNDSRRHVDLDQKLSDAKTFSIYLWKSLATMRDHNPPFWWSVGDDNSTYDNLKWAAFREFVKEIDTIFGDVESMEKGIKEVSNKLKKEFYEKIIEDAKKGLPDTSQKPRYFHDIPIDTP